MLARSSLYLLALAALTSIVSASPTPILTGSDLAARAHPRAHPYPHPHPAPAAGVGHLCKTDKGCASGHCIVGRCSSSAGNGRTNGSPCSKDLQCASGSFCGLKTCLPQQGAGGYCYMNSGCTSNSCSNFHCKAPVTVPAVGANNDADFSSGKLGPWTATGDVTIVADPTSPGGYVARLGPGASISREGLTGGQITDSRTSTSTSTSTRKRGEEYWLWETDFEFLIHSYTADSNGYGGCFFKGTLNDLVPGDQSIGVEDMKPDWQGEFLVVTSGHTAPLTSISVGTTCHPGASMVVDVRNIVRKSEYLFTSTDTPDAGEEESDQ